MIVMSIPHELSSTTSSSQHGTTQPTAYDILLGRHKHCFHHIGNQAFRILITKFMTLYSTLETKREKMNLVTRILQIIHQGGGRFLREAGDSQWSSVKKRTAREKISHALRDHCNRILFRNNNNTIGSGGGATTTTSTTRSSAPVPTPTASWRTLVYETVQNQKGTAKKTTTTVIANEPPPSQQYDHLDTKNHSFSLSGNTRQQIANIQEYNVETTRRNLVNSMMRSNQLSSSLPMPRYLPPTSSTTTNARSLPMYDPGSTTSSMLMNDATRQIELLGGRSEVAAAARDERLPEETAPWTSSIFGIPTNTRLVAPSSSSAAAARRHSLTNTYGGADESKMSDFQMNAFGSPMRSNISETIRRDSLGAFFEPSDTFGFGQPTEQNDAGESLLNPGEGLAGGDGDGMARGGDFLASDGMDLVGSGSGSGFARLPNQEVAASLIDMHHAHQHQHSQQDESMDPIPFIQHSLMGGNVPQQQLSSPAAAFPPPASYMGETEESQVASHHHSQQHAQQDNHQQQESSSGTSRHERKNTDQQIDSLLLDLFKR